MFDKNQMHSISESVALAFLESLPPSVPAEARMAALAPTSTPATVPAISAAGASTAAPAYAPPTRHEPAASLGERRRHNEYSGVANAALLPLLCAALDELDYALILLDERGMVAHANLRARVDLENGRLAVDRGRLYAAQASQQMPLQTALERARRGARSMVDLSVDENHPKATHMYALIPFGGTGTGSAAGNGVGVGGSGRPNPVLVVSGRQCLSEALSTQFFATRFGLSPAEQGVLRGLVTGLSAEEVAAQRGLKVATVRGQIKDIRRKTQCSSMRELLAKVAVLPPVMRALRAAGG